MPTHASMPRAKGVKGFVLAAGLGTRLRPITEALPKPLIPFAGTTPLSLALWRLAQAGVDEVAINTHYLPEQIEAAAARSPHGQRIRLSHEPEILGTGGAYSPLYDWAQDDDLLVLNGDVVSDMDIAQLLEVHRRTEAAATMMLLPAGIPGERHVFERGGEVLHIGRELPAGQSGVIARSFACAQVISPEFRRKLPRSGSFDIISEGYLPALADGLRVSCLTHPGYWHDLGSPQRLAEALFALIASPDAAKRVGVDACRAAEGLTPAPPYHDGEIDPTAAIGPAVIVERGARVEPGATLRRAILLPGSQASAGASVVDSLLWREHTMALSAPR